MKKYKVILLSGGFDPVHKGHVECIENALKLADEVWVGINNDYWLTRKKGKPFMDQTQRAYIMNAFKGVSWVYIMNPENPSDDTAIDFINAARKRYLNLYGSLPRGVMAFGNGGDRVETTTPENATCDVMGIDSVWNLGEKIESSSWLLENYIKK